MNNEVADNYAERAKVPESNSLDDYWLYLRSFAKRGLDVASLVPSSRWTAQSMLRGIDFTSSTIVVELGAGTGAVTASLLQAARGKCRALIVEREPEFCERLRKRFPGAEIIADDALKLHEILQRSGIDRVDHVLSTLPINWLPAEQQSQFLASISSHLEPSGSFRQLTHLPWIHRKMYQEYFASVKCPIVLRNLPPAGCYVCRRPRTLESDGNTS